MGIEFWSARGCTSKTSGVCDRCDKDSHDLAYSRIANMHLCESCFDEALDINRDYFKRLNAWKENR